MLLRFFHCLNEYFEETLAVVFQTVMVLCLTYTAIVRYFVIQPFFTALSHKAEELALFSFVALLYFGAVIAIKKNSHFRITAHFMLIPKHWRKYAYIPGELAWQGLNLFLIYQGWLLVRSALVFPEPSLSLQVPMWIIYLIIPVSFGLSFLRLFKRHCRGRFGNNGQGESAAGEAVEEVKHAG